MRRDKTHAAHVGGKGVHLIDIAGRFQAVVPATEIEDLEFVRVNLGKLGKFQIDTTHPIAFFSQIGH